jgi:hypothetical protein
MCLRQLKVVSSFRLQEGLLHDQTVFGLQITALERDVRELTACRELNRTSYAAALVARIRSQLTEAQSQAELFNRREQLFDRPLTDYGVLDQLHAQVRPEFITIRF